MAAMFVHVLTSLHDAKVACRMVFGEDADAGPQIRTPEPLLDFLKQWPGHAEDVLEAALHLPAFMHNAEQATASGNVQAVTVRLCKLDVLYEGRKVGEALRTNAEGLAGIAVYAKAMATLRNIH